MRLVSALGRLCLLYFLLTAEKGQGNAAAATSPSATQEKTTKTTTTTTTGSDFDSASEDVAVVVVRRLMELADLQQQISTTEERLHTPSMEEGGGGGGSPTQRLALVLWSVLGERDQLKLKLEASEDEVARLKEELSSQMDQHHSHRNHHHHRHDYEISPKDDACPCSHEMAKALSQFQKQQKQLLIEEVAGLQCNRLEESISFIQRDLMMIINDNKKQQQQQEKEKTIFKNDTETQINTEEDEEEKMPEESVMASDCYELFVSGKKESGVYIIYPQGDASEEGVSVWCDMGEGKGRDGEEATVEAGKGSGGWTVILLRRLLDKQVNFTRGWDDYKAGFGTPQSEYWIGNEVLHQLTSSSEGKPQQALWVVMTDYDNVTKDAFYTKFSVGSEDEDFPLGYDYSFDRSRSSVLGDSLYWNKGEKFSTIDKDNDEHSSLNCAQFRGGGGFWWENCGYANPTAPILPKGKSSKGLYWWNFNRDTTHLKDITMKIRPYSG